MAHHFKCRLLLVRAGEDRFRIRYGHLLEPCERVLCIKGPSVVVPP